MGVKCHKCGAESPDGKRFCGDCGALLGPAAEIDPVAIREAVRSILRDEHAGQKVLEVETAQAVVSRLTDWGKLFGFVVGIPLAILLLGLGALGIKTYADFAGIVESGKKDVSAQVAAAKGQIRALSTEEAELSRQYAELRSRLADNQQLADQVEALAKRVDVIGEKLGFVPTSQATPQQRTLLSEAFGRFTRYLRSVGYSSRGGDVRIDVRERMQSGVIAYYDSNTRTLVIDKKYASDPIAMYREYMHHVLYSGGRLDRSSHDGGWMYNAIESGLATYIPCSFQNDPGATGGTWKLDRATRKLAEVRDVGTAMLIGTEVWGSAFWELRALVGAPVADRLLLQSWDELRPEEAANAQARTFVSKVLSRVDGAQRAKARDIFARRGIPT